MNNVSKTLYIPLFGKAYVSQTGMILTDKKAEEIWSTCGFALSGRAASKWLAYYMGMRAAVFDRRVKELLQESPEAIVLHVGCGLDSRVLRMNAENHRWYDVDFSAVIAERKKHYSETQNYRMVAGDVREEALWEHIPKAKQAVVIMEGMSMYLTADELQAFGNKLCTHFDSVVLIADFYSTFAAKMSKYKNPVNSVGVSKVYGTDKPCVFKTGTLAFTQEHNMTPDDLIAQLPAKEQKIFNKLYAGGFAKRLYRLYEYRKEE